jgi:hypothetical protein
VRVPVSGLIELTQLAASRLNAELSRWFGTKERPECGQTITHFQTASVPLTSLVLLAQQGKLAGVGVLEQKRFRR